MEKRLAARGMAVPVKEVRPRKPAPMFVSTRALRSTERALVNHDEQVSETFRSVRRLSIGVCAENVIQPTRTSTSSEEPCRPRVTRRTSMDATSCAETVVPVHSPRQYQRRELKSPRHRRASIGCGGGRKTSRRSLVRGASDARQPSSHEGPPPFDLPFDEREFPAFDDTIDYEDGDTDPMNSNDFVAFPDSSDFSSGFDDPTELSSSGFGYEYSSELADTTDYGYGEDDSPHDYELGQPSNEGSERNNERAPVIPNSPQSAPKNKGRRTTKVPRRSSLACKC
eukprot:scaffold7872_cov158-Amphora_coffeaeformis.AAC.1